MADIDLTGRAGGYRGIAIRCPGCAEPMRQVALTNTGTNEGAEVDVCDGCGGLWVDWFDGEVRTIATETLRVREKESGAKDPRGPSSPSPPPARHNESIALGACPRCTRHLVSERYVIKTEVPSDRVEGRISTPATTTTGAELLRCEDCMGSFVSASSAEVLSWLGTTEEAPPSTSPAVLKPMPWAHFLEVIKSLVGLKKT